eukprot:8780446-Alexandrium_andersonii.AAC.1
MPGPQLICREAPPGVGQRVARSLVPEPETMEVRNVNCFRPKGEGRALRAILDQRDLSCAS